MPTPKSPAPAVTEVAAGIGMIVAGHRPLGGWSCGRTRRPSLERIRGIIKRGPAECEVNVFVRAGHRPQQVRDPLAENVLPALLRLKVAPPEQVDDRHCQEGNA